MRSINYAVPKETGTKALCWAWTIHECSIQRVLRPALDGTAAREGRHVCGESWTGSPDWSHPGCRRGIRNGRGPVLGLTPNMRMQLTRPRERWPAAERWTSASLQLIRGRWADLANGSHRSRRQFARHAVGSQCGAELES